MRVCRPRRSALSGAVLAVALAALPIAAQDLDVEGMANAGLAWAHENLPAELLEQLPLPSDADWQAFWSLVRNTLDNGTLERAADLTPYAETAVRLLGRVQGGEEYAAWLRQRLDYFEVASAVVKQLPAPPAPSVPTPAPRPAQPIQGVVRILPSAPMVLPVVPTVLHQQREQASRSPALWRRVMSRRPQPASALALVPDLKRAFHTEGVAPQLVWLAEVESSMDPHARNPGGAVGLFQFMPPTAKRFGLRTFPFDERKDPGKSARAAAQYLKFLYGQFGSWPLAVAAYNAGEGRVKALLAKAGGTTFDDIASRLPFETQMYVPKVQAVIQLREGVDLSGLPAPGTGQAAFRMALPLAVAWVR